MSNRASFARKWGLIFVTAFLLVSAGCAGLPLEASWGSVSLVGDPAQISFAYADRLVYIDPVDGSRSELRDSDGAIRLDESGNPRSWIVQSANPHATFYTEPIPLEGNTVLVTAYEKLLFEVDSAAARVLNPAGVTLPGHVVATPVVNGNLLYVPLSETNLVALDTENNYQTVWTFNTERGNWASPLLLNDVLYVPSMDHNLYALNPTTGEQLWALDLGGAVASTPVFANDHLYVGSFARKVFKISLDGSIVAEYTTNEWVWGAPSVVEDQVYVSDLGGYVYSLRDEGSEFTAVWSRQVAQRGIRATPLVTEDALVVGSRDRFVYWISRETGEELVRREMKGEILADLLLVEPTEGLSIEPMVVVSTLAREELLVAFTLDDGERRWVYGL